MLLATFKRIALLPRVWQQCVRVCVCPTLIIDHKNCLLACVVIIDKQVVLISGQPSSPSTSSRRTQPTISTQPERDPHNYKTISPQTPSCSSVLFPDAGTPLSPPSLLLSSTRTTSAAGTGTATVTAYWLIFTVYPQFARRRERGVEGEEAPLSPV